jgi:hypothetical protein
VKIFGREPAAIVGAIQALLALAISFGWLAGVGLTTQDDLALVMAVVSGVAALYLAYVTSETLLAPVVEVIKADLALAAIYGFHLTTEQTGFAIAAITAVLAGWQRDRTSPLTHPSFTVIAPDDTVTPKAA